jgi:hypothetical protein
MFYRLRWLKFQVRRKLGLDKEETRCYLCREATDCPAFQSGVCYPCPYFRM